MTLRRSKHPDTLSLYSRSPKISLLRCRLVSCCRLRASSGDPALPEALRPRVISRRPTRYSIPRRGCLQLIMAESHASLHLNGCLALLLTYYAQKKPAFPPTLAPAAAHRVPLPKSQSASPAPELLAPGRGPHKQNSASFLGSQLLPPPFIYRFVATNPVSSTFAGASGPAPWDGSAHMCRRGAAAAAAPALSIASFPRLRRSFVALAR
ncbi:hypothetical protein B0J12DRAFT_284635 [Macrophomina phaseolina]|uniref:Uncharacterized protein n=1 Tax=Macrophomina phaseolina TaxID=35725 RepID=A0ABQ8GN45_9PEZI|nr:hypothetical protein B0J12DRAFT_284635 [Macrophomina phaseolina]